MQANPAHEDRGGYLRDSDIEDLCLKAQNDPSLRSDYLRYHLNIWGHGTKENPAIDMAKWIACGGGEDLCAWPCYDVELLISRWKLGERPCFAGVDLSWTTDLSAVVCVFPPFAAIGQWTLLPFFVMAEERIKAQERKDKVPYSEWARRGFITSTPGEVIDFETIRERIAWERKMFDVEEVDFDPWSSLETQQLVAREGALCVTIPGVSASHRADQETAGTLSDRRTAAWQSSGTQLECRLPDAAARPQGQLPAVEAGAGEIVQADRRHCRYDKRAGARDGR